MTQTLADMRRDYTREGLSEANAPDEPFALFRQWFDDAVKTEQPPVEPNAMTLERQVRIEGRVEKVSAEESDAYYQVRPLGSRLGAWASPQSRVIRDRAELERLLAETERRFLDQAPHCPPHWGGYRLLPERIEFWQGRPSRLHDRLNYRHVAGTWQRERLAP